jgi:hypothetical protein
MSNISAVSTLWRQGEQLAQQENHHEAIVVLQRAKAALVTEDVDGSQQ